MSISIVKSRNCDVTDLVNRSSVAGLYDAHLMLKRWLRTSEEVWLGMHDDKVACVWGIIPPSIVADRAYLWLFTTDLVEQHKFIFIRHSQLVVKDALERYPVIVGHVVNRNRAAKKWLEWLGAHIDAPDEGVCSFVIRRK